MQFIPAYFPPIAYIVQLINNDVIFSLGGTTKNRHTETEAPSTEPMGN